MHLFLKKKFAVVMSRGGYLKLSKANKKCFVLFCFFLHLKFISESSVTKKIFVCDLGYNLMLVFNLLCFVAIWQKIKNSSAYQPVF